MIHLLAQIARVAACLLLLLLGTILAVIGAVLALPAAVVLVGALLAARGAGGVIKSKPPEGPAIETEAEGNGSLLSLVERQEGD